MREDGSKDRGNKTVTEESGRNVRSTLCSRRRGLEEGTRLKRKADRKDGRLT